MLALSTELRDGDKVCRKNAWVDVRRFEVDNSPIYIDVDKLLAQCRRYDGG